MSIKIAKAKCTLIFSIAIAVFLVIIGVTNFSSIAGESLDYTSEEAFSWAHMVDGRTVSQDFVAIHSDIREMSFTIDNCADKTGSLVVRITSEDGSVIYENNISLENQSENYTVSIPVLSMQFEKNATYNLSITASGTSTSSQETPMVRLFSIPESWERVFPLFHNALSERTGQSCLNITFFHYRYVEVALLAVASVLILLCAFFDVSFEKVEDEEKREKIEKIRKYVNYVFALLVPFFTFLVFELANGYLSYIETVPFWLNVAIFYALFAALSFITGRIRVVSMILELILGIYGVVNFFVSGFKGEPIMPYDFAAANTAMTVAGSYEFVFTYSVTAAIILLWVLFIFTSKLKVPVIRGKKHLITGAAAGVIGIGFICCLIFTDILSDNGISVRYWRLTESYRSHGYMLNTCISIGDMIITAPSGYSTDAILEQAETFDTSADESVTKPTNIIVIMNESYADLRYINDFDASENVYTTLDSLYNDENTFTTRLHMDVYGAGTSTSEYMVLTGNATEFLPSGTSPYYLYCGENEYGLASILGEQGYHTVAMHPNLASNWDRDTVYEEMGFDEFLSIDDFEGYDTLRDYVSDMGDYQRLIDLYEDKEEGEQLFVFNVTMQNHGAYTYTGYNFDQDVYYYGDNYYSKTNQYLSLLKQSDQALKYLLDYFDNVDEPTMVVFFGDHLPSLGNAFFNELFGESMTELSSERLELRYTTPAFIWTNYDCSFDDYSDISADYLGQLILKYAGVQTTDYNQMLLNQMETLPVVGHMGVMDSEGNFTSWEDVTNDESLNTIVNNYRSWQYNYIFGKNNRLDQVFDLEGSPAGVPVRESTEAANSGS